MMLFRRRARKVRRSSSILSSISKTSFVCMGVWTVIPDVYWNFTTRCNYDLYTFWTTNARIIGLSVVEYGAIEIISGERAKMRDRQLDLCSGHTVQLGGNLPGRPRR